MRTPRDATLLMAELGAWGEDADFPWRLSRGLRARDLRFSAADRPEVSERTLGIMPEADYSSGAGDASAARAN